MKIKELKDLRTKEVKDLNAFVAKKKLEVIRNSVNRGKPYGSVNWTNKVLKKFGLEITERKRGRPKKGS